MGFFSGIRRRIKKIIPKEVKPFLPYIAAGFGPSTAGLTFGSGLGTALAQRGQELQSLMRGLEIFGSLAQTMPVMDSVSYTHLTLPTKA